MALRLRRGTDAERLTIIPQEGELIYTIDTKELYAGDGTTVGGNGISGSTDGSPAQLTQNLNLNSNNITGTGNININGFVTADFNGGLIGDVLGDIQGSVFANNSTLLVDALDGIIFAENVRGEFTGNVIGDIKGSVFADDSTIIVNGQTGVVTASLIGDVVGSVFGDDSTVIVNGLDGSITTNEIFGNSALKCDNGFGVTLVDTSDYSALRFIRNDIGIDIADPSTTVAYGVVRWERNDINGNEIAVYMQGGSDGFKVFNLTNGSFDTTKQIHFDMGGSFGIGKSPTTKLDVNGAGTFSEGVAADSITSSSYVQFGSITTIARNALTAVNGMVVYNTTDDRFQGYQAGAWINLDDGTAA